MSGLQVLLIASTFLGVVFNAPGAESSTCANELCQNNGECKMTNENTYECHCKSGFTGTNCQTMTKTNRELKNRTLSITVKTTLYDLYVDGIKRNVTYGDNWTRPDEIFLSPLDRLVSVMAIDSTESCAGIIASVTDDYLVTDDIDWQCSFIPDPTWYQLQYDDAAWPPAYLVGPNNNVTWPDECVILAGIPTISPDAYWIWTDTIPDTPAYHQTIYCRGYLPLCERDSPCLNGGTCQRNNHTLCSCLLGFIGEFCEYADTKDVEITAKHDLYAAYVDGVQRALPNGDNWLITDSLNISSISRLLAVMAIQLDGSCPGILASVSDSYTGEYLLTNARWKCSASATVGWAELGYNDAAWPNATIIHQNELTNDTDCWDQFVEITPISSSAYWIWTDTTVRQDVVVYCRGYLPICDVHPCKNGGTCNRNSVNLCTCLSNTTGKYCELAIPQNATMSSEDEDRSEKLGSTDDLVLNPLHNPVPPHNPVPQSDPYHAPIQPSDETGNRNVRDGIRKNHNG